MLRFLQLCQLLGFICLCILYALHHCSPCTAALHLSCHSTDNNSKLAIGQLVQWKQKTCNWWWRSQQWLIFRSTCPFMRILIVCAVTLPLYNVLLIVIGWHLHRSSSNALQVLLAPPSTPTTQQIELPVPPTRPPRRKVRRAPQPPNLQKGSFLIDSYPSHKNPFASTLERKSASQYLSLQRNLQRALEGLQKPSLSSSTSPVFIHRTPVHITEKNITHGHLPQPKRKSLLHSVIKRLRRPFSRHKSVENTSRNSFLSHLPKQAQLPTNSIPSASSSVTSSVSSSGWLYSH